MRRRIYIFVRGILGRAGDAKEWNARALPWIFNNTPDFADNFETVVGPIDRLIGQGSRARNFSRTIKEYRRCEEPNIVVVAHSNGADIVLKGLRLGHWPRIEALHLVSAACDADFTANGLNQALLSRLVGRVCLYRAGRDRALPLAKIFWPQFWTAQPLGATGPLNVYDQVKDRVGEIVNDTFGHSTWFNKANFDKSMHHFTQPIPLSKKMWVRGEGEPL